MTAKYASPTLVEFPLTPFLARGAHRWLDAACSLPNGAEGCILEGIHGFKQRSAAL